MSDTRNRPGVASGPAPNLVGETTTSVPRSWHEQCEREGQWWYAEGYADGWAAAEKAIAEEISRAVGVKPCDRREVIRWLIDGIGRIPARRPEPFSSSANGTTLTVAERQSFGELGRCA